MKNIIVAILMAITLIFASSVPASAAPAPVGWTNSICTNVVNHNITVNERVCSKVYINSQSLLNWVEICSTRTPEEGWGINGIKNNSISAQGSSESLPDQGKTECKTSYVGFPVTLRGQYVAQGTINVASHPDQQWYLCGRFDSGSYC